MPTSVTQVPVFLFEGGTNIGHRSRGIIGCRVHNHGNPMGAIPFINNLLKTGGITDFKSLIDGILDFVFGHIRCPSVLNGPSQSRIAIGFAATGFNGHTDLSTTSGKCFVVSGTTLHDGVLTVFERATHIDTFLFSNDLWP